MDPILLQRRRLTHEQPTELSRDLKCRLPLSGLHFWLEVFTLFKSHEAFVVTTSRRGLYTLGHETSAASPFRTQTLENLSHYL